MTTFEITIRPAYFVTMCEEYKAQEKRGLFGCHNSQDCPNCIRELRYYEMQGSNGFFQGTFDNKPTEEMKAAYIKRWSTPTKQIVLKESEFGYTYKA